MEFLLLQGSSGRFFSFQPLNPLFHFAVERKNFRQGVWNRDREEASNQIKIQKVKWFEYGK